MSAEENKRLAQEGYAAFSSGDAETAMANIDDNATWNVRGDNSLTGKYTGKQEIGELWGKLAEGGFSVKATEFIADGDKVVVLTTAEMQGEKVDTADICTYNDEGKMTAFDSLSDETVANRIYAR